MHVCFRLLTVLKSDLFLRYYLSQCSFLDSPMSDYYSLPCWYFKCPQSQCEVVPMARLSLLCVKGLGETSCSDAGTGRTLFHKIQTHLLHALKALFFAYRHCCLMNQYTAKPGQACQWQISSFKFQRPLIVKKAVKDCSPNLKELFVSRKSIVDLGLQSYCFSLVAVIDSYELKVPHGYLIISIHFLPQSFRSSTCRFFAMLKLGFRCSKHKLSVRGFRQIIHYLPYYGVGKL